MSNRELDYYMKNLPFDVRQEIINRIDKINSAIVKELLEKNEGYPSFKSMGYSKENVLTLLKQSTERFKNVNDIMIENERYPLFSNPKDTYNSSLEYVEILKKKTPEELLEKFGCTWEDYKPLIYKKEDMEKKMEKNTEDIEK